MSEAALVFPLHQSGSGKDRYMSFAERISQLLGVRLPR